MTNCDHVLLNIFPTLVDTFLFTNLCYVMSLLKIFCYNSFENIIINKKGTDINKMDLFSFDRMKLVFVTSTRSVKKLDKFQFIKSLYLFVRFIARLNIP